MDKAYDINGLVEKLKEHGMDVAEDAARAAVISVIDWIEASAQLSENTYDDLLLAILPLAKPQILAMIDKIDGEEG